MYLHFIAFYLFSLLDFKSVFSFLFRDLMFVCFLPSYAVLAFGLLLTVFYLKIKIMD